MKKIMFALFIATFSLTQPIISASWANDGIDYYYKLKKESDERSRGIYGEDSRITKNANNPYDNNIKDDRSTAFKNKRAKKSQQFDTWGRDGGQHKSSAEILSDMMNPAKKR